MSFDFERPIQCIHTKLPGSLSQADFVVLCADAKERHTMTAATQADQILPDSMI